MVKTVGALMKLAIAAAAIWFAVMVSVFVLEDSGWPGEVSLEMVVILTVGWSFLMLWSYVTFSKPRHKIRRRR